MFYRRRLLKLVCLTFARIFFFVCSFVMSTCTYCMYVCMYVLPLSHKSGALCLYEPLPVSDALGDDFFEIFDVFLVKTFFFFLF